MTQTNRNRANPTRAFGTRLTTRRALTALAVAASLAGALGCNANNEPRVDNDRVMSSSDQRSMTPDQAIDRLKAGNRRFVRGEHTQFDYIDQAEATAAGQFPHSIVLSCLDSRVPVEAVFDQGIGDIFVGRVAGNFENTDMLGSMEFGTKLAGSKLIVVLGHTSCGAVKGAIAGAEMGNLTATLANIRPAINAVGMSGSADDSRYVSRVVEANVRRTVQDIQSRSEVISQLVRDGDLKVVGAVYDLETGRVSWMN